MCTQANTHIHTRTHMYLILLVGLFYNNNNNNNVFIYIAPLKTLVYKVLWHKTYRKTFRKRIERINRKNKQTASRKSKSIKMCSRKWFKRGYWFFKLCLYGQVVPKLRCNSNRHSDIIKSTRRYVVSLHFSKAWSFEHLFIAIFQNGFTKNKSRSPKLY